MMVEYDSKWKTWYYFDNKDVPDRLRNLMEHYDIVRYEYAIRFLDYAPYNYLHILHSRVVFSDGSCIVSKHRGFLGASVDSDIERIMQDKSIIRGPCEELSFEWEEFCRAEVLE